MSDYAPMAQYFRDQLGLPLLTNVCEFPAGTRITRCLRGFIAVHPEHEPVLVHPWGPQPLRPGQVVAVECLP